MTNSEPKQGMSTQKKWLVVCGAGLSILLLIAIVLASIMLTNTDVTNTEDIKDTSSQTFTEVFGKSFDPGPYRGNGVSVEHQGLHHILFMANGKGHLGLFALDFNTSPSVAKQVQSGDTTPFNQLLEQAASSAHNSGSVFSSGASYFKRIHLAATKPITLPNGKTLILNNAGLSGIHEGKPIEAPAVVAFIPEENNRLVLMTLFSHKEPTGKQADFDKELTTLQKEMVRIVSDSELDDRMISTKPIPTVKK
jgi:hypothetical protein